MLIATGRTEMKVGSGEAGALTGEEAGKAALGAVATQAFKGLVADKLPLDTIAVDSGAVRAGKYVTDKIYVGYVRRFDADVERGENEDEMRDRVPDHAALDRRVALRHLRLGRREPRVVEGLLRRRRSS